MAPQRLLFHGNAAGTTTTTTNDDDDAQREDDDILTRIATTAGTTPRKQRPRARSGVKDVLVPESYAISVAYLHSLGMDPDADLGEVHATLLLDRPSSPWSDAEADDDGESSPSSPRSSSSSSSLEMQPRERGNGLVDGDATPTPPPVSHHSNINHTRHRRILIPVAQSVYESPPPLNAFARPINKATDVFVVCPWATRWETFLDALDAAGLHDSFVWVDALCAVPLPHDPTHDVHVPPPPATPNGGANRNSRRMSSATSATTVTPTPPSATSRRISASSSWSSMVTSGSTVTATATATATAPLVDAMWDLLTDGDADAELDRDVASDDAADSISSDLLDVDVDVDAHDNDDVHDDFPDVADNALTQARQARQTIALMRQCHHVLVVISPWSRPLAFSRAVPASHLLNALDARVPVRVILPPTDRRDLSRDVVTMVNDDDGYETFCKITRCVDAASLATWCDSLDEEFKTATARTLRARRNELDAVVMAPLRDVFRSAARALAADARPGTTSAGNAYAAASVVFYALQDFPESLSWQRKSLEASRAANDPPAWISEKLASVATLLRAMSDYAGALEAQREALAINSSVLGPVHRDVANDWCEVACILDEAGQKLDALEAFDEAIRVRKAAAEASAAADDQPPEVDPQLAHDLACKASVLADLGRHAEALEVYDAAIHVRVLACTGAQPPSGSTALPAPGTGPATPRRASSASASASTTMPKSPRTPTSSSSSAASHVTVNGTTNIPHDVDVGALLHHKAGVYRAAGDLASALTSFAAARSILTACLGNDHVDVAKTLSDEASVLRAVGRRQDALAALEEALQTYRRALGEDECRIAPAFATALAKRGRVLEELGRKREALDAYVRALAVRRRAWRAEASHLNKSSAAVQAKHLEVASSLIDVASVLQELRRIPEALHACREALRIRRNAYPHAHSDVAHALVWVASLEREAGHVSASIVAYEDASEVYRRVLDATALGARLGVATNLAKTLSSLARVLDETPGRKLDAVRAYGNVVDVRRSDPLAETDPGALAAALIDWASALSDVGKYKEALAACEEALCVRRAIHGAKPHRDVAHALVWVASVLRDVSVAVGSGGDSAHARENLERAVELHDEALRMRETLFGVRSTEVLKSLAAKAYALDDLERREEALELHDRVVAARREKLSVVVVVGDHAAEDGPVSSQQAEIRSLADALLDRAWVLRGLDRLPEALTAYEEALRAHEQAGGRLDAEVARDMNFCAAVLRRMGRFDEAAAYLERALDISRETGRRDEAYALKNLALVRRAQGRMADALEAHARAMAVFRERFGADDPETKRVEREWVVGVPR